MRCIIERSTASYSTRNKFIKRCSYFTFEHNNSNFESKQVYGIIFYISHPKKQISLKAGRINKKKL